MSRAPSGRRSWRRSPFTWLMIAAAFVGAALWQPVTPDESPWVDADAPAGEAPDEADGEERDAAEETDDAAEETDDAAEETDDAAEETDDAELLPQESPEAHGEPPAPRELPPHLVDHLEGILEAETISEVEELSVAVLDADGRLLASRDPERVVTPASTQKLVTAAAALRLLGEEYRFTTRVLATGPIEDGVLDGDLVIVGGGDPTLASEPFRDEVNPQRPHTEIEPLVDGVVDADISEIDGSVLGDPQLFADEPVAEGWLDRYFQSLDTANSSGLTIDAGRQIFERDSMLVGEAAEEPATTTAEVVDDLLDEQDVTISGDPELAEGEVDGEELARVDSPPLHELLTYVVQESDNHMADAIYRTLGAVTDDPTWAGSADAAREALDDLGPHWEDTVLTDGSGLSRDGRLSGHLLAELDRKMTANFADDWDDLLAVSGESGTLRERLIDTPADGLVFAKTGTLRDTRALAGHVYGSDDERYHFAILGAELEGPETQAVRRLQDDVALVLADAPDCPAGDDPGTCAAEDESAAEDDADSP